MFDLIYKIDNHQYYIHIFSNFIIMNIIIDSIYVETYKHYITIKR